MKKSTDKANWEKEWLRVYCDDLRQRREKEPLPAQIQR